MVAMRDNDDNTGWVRTPPGRQKRICIKRVKMMTMLDMDRNPPWETQTQSGGWFEHT